MYRVPPRGAINSRWEPNQKGHMKKLLSILAKSLISGTVASAVSAAVLGVLAKAEGSDPVQPINATSHWLHGDQSGKITAIDAKHTGTGLATHHGACVMWASLFETLRAASPGAGLTRIARDAATVSIIAAIVDYGLVPKRLTPGWEEPLPIRSVAGGFAGLALGLTIGGMITGQRR
jgi:hypothetical protein